MNDETAVGAGLVAPTPPTHTSGTDIFGRSITTLQQQAAAGDPFAKARLTQVQNINTTYSALADLSRAGVLQRTASLSSDPTVRAQLLSQAESLRNSALSSLSQLRDSIVKAGGTPGAGFAAVLDVQKSAQQLSQAVQSGGVTPEKADALAVGMAEQIVKQATPPPSGEAIAAGEQARAVSSLGESLKKALPFIIIGGGALALLTTILILRRRR